MTTLVLDNKTNKLYWIVLIFAFAVQGMGIYFLINQNESHALLYHFISSVLFPLPLWKLMPAKFRDEPLIMLLLFLTCALIPFIAGAGLFFSFTLGAYYSKPHKIEITDQIEAEELPENVIETMQLADYNGSSLFAILEVSEHEDNRMKAVLKTRQMTDQESIPILKMALLDPVDEIRLLAYSMLDKKEKVIETLIKSYNVMIRDEPDEKHTIVHFKLAESYWELSYLGLAHGKAQIHILQNAYEHIQKVLKETVKDAEAYFLQAKITLILEQFDVSEHSFLQALECGMSETRVSPYQAELAFVRRRFNEISHYVQAVDDTAKENELVSGMLEQWG